MCVTFARLNLRRTLHVCLLVFAAMVGSPRAGFAQLNEAQLAARRSTELTFSKRFRGSLAGLSTYLGSGTFILDDYSNNPYVSQELLIRPRFWVGRRHNVQLLWLIECEYTAPDDLAGRHCWPSDLRLSYHHVKLWQDPWIGGRVMGSAQAWLPTSIQSQNNHTVVNLRGTVGYIATVLKSRLQFGYTFGLQKYLPTSKVRGLQGSQTDDAGVPLCFARSSASAGGACGSGGRMNDNWLLSNGVGIQWYFTPKVWLSVDFSIWNYFRFSVDELGADPELPQAGRADFTWGVIELGYQWREHLVFAFGTSSRQPALTPDGDLPRFPFWDFVSPSNNYSKFYLTATWVY